MSQPTRLSVILGYAESYYGKQVSTDREFLVGQINAFRGAAFKDQAMRDNLFKDEGCECVQVFEDVCGGGRCESFTGITLPSGVEAVDHLEFRNARINITSMVVPNGLVCRTGCGPLVAQIESVDALLKNPIPRGYGNPIIFQPQDARDKGMVGVEYVDTTGKIIREDVVLSGQGNATSRPAQGFTSITFPERCGSIRVMTIDGYSLGEYAQNIPSPKHRLIHLNGIARGALVKWWGTKRPLPVKYDSDLVEWDGEIDWKTAFSWMNLHLTESRTPAQTDAYRTASAYLAAGADAELRATQHSPARNLQPRSVSSLGRRMRLLG